MELAPPEQIDRQDSQRHRQTDRQTGRELLLQSTRGADVQNSNMSKRILEFLALLEFEEVSNWYIHDEKKLPQMAVGEYCSSCFTGTLMDHHSKTDPLQNNCTHTLITKARHCAQKPYI